MKKLDPMKDGRSPDLTEAAIEEVKRLFPTVVREGKVDFDALRAELGDDVDEGGERYGLSWPGRTEAHQVARSASSGTLRPMPDVSLDWNRTQNLFIEGDNLEVLKLLQRSYHRKVKLIYIDPPYNTGGDFVYPDDFSAPIDTYKRLTAQVTEEGLPRTANPETSGRFHSTWLSMMYPRLFLARSLLKDEGAIFVSCDEGEHPRLRLLLDEIFGPENFVADMVWAAGRKNDSKLISVSHEYIVCYARDMRALKDLGVEWKQRKKGLDEIYAEVARIQAAQGEDYEAATKDLKAWFRSLPDNHPAKAHKHYSRIDTRGAFFAADIAWPGRGGPRYEVLHPETGKPVRVPTGGWRYTDPETMRKLIEDDRVFFGDTHERVPNIKRYLEETEFQSPYSVFYQDGRAATKRLRKLMGADVFDFPKDEEVLGEIIEMLTDGDDIVMDFFAGSGTTGHAVFAQNAKDGGERRFILVQLPEPLSDENKGQEAAAAFCAEHGLEPTIASLTRERLRRAAGQVQEQFGEGAITDRGFRAYRLDASNMRAWDPTIETLQEDLLAAVDHVKSDRTSADVLHEIMLKYGLDLALSIDTHDAGAGPTIYSVADGALLACLDQKIDDEVVARMVALHEELEPEVTRVVFLDAGFVDDVVKTNAVQTLRLAGIEDVRSI